MTAEYFVNRSAIIKLRREVFSDRVTEGQGKTLLTA